MASANQRQDTIATLTRIKSLWEEAESYAASPPQPVPGSAPASAMERIDVLMNEAEKLDPAKPATSPENEPLPSEDDIIDELAARVETAANAVTPDISTEDFASVKTRMEAVSRLQPSHQDNSHTQSPEYAFGDAFSTLIRHVVRQYIDDEFEDVMRQAIKSELTRQNWEVDDTKEKPSRKKRAK